MSATAAPIQPKKDLVARDFGHPELDSVHDEELTNQLHALAIGEKNDKSSSIIQPADFVTLQSIRSSALARKMNTTSKISKGSESLFSDLLNRKKSTDSNSALEKDGDKEEKADKSDNKKCDEGDKEDNEKSGKESESDAEDNSQEDSESEEGDLLSRGPVRTTRNPLVQAHHPYYVSSRQPAYGMAAQSNVDDFSSYSAYGGGYECGASAWTDSPDTFLSSCISTPETMTSTESGYAPSISPSSPYVDSGITVSEVNRLLNTSCDLPDRLVDFILSYSRTYEKHEETVIPQRPSSTDSSSCPADSPLSAISVPHCSPGAPQTGVCGRISPQTVTRTAQTVKERPARMRFRGSMAQEELDQGVLWVCKCIQLAPGALEHRDVEQDSLLHVLLYHHDMPRVLPKLYALVEQQLKLEFSPDQAPFDLKNRFDETPLVLAVIIRKPLIVEYLLEAGANPNILPLRGPRDSPLHYASSRGLNDIVKILVGDRRTQLNLKNGVGMTPLHCAVKHHGATDEETGQTIDNSNVISTLLRSGADPLQTTSTEGKTIVHLAAESFKASIIEDLRHSMNEEILTELVNKPDFNRETPLDVLENLKSSIDETTYSNLFFALLTCGANVPGKRD